MNRAFRLVISRSTAAVAFALGLFACGAGGDPVDSVDPVDPPTGVDAAKALKRGMTATRPRGAVAIDWNELDVDGPPIAKCADVVVSAGETCGATASIDAGSYAPGNKAPSCTQKPLGPYPLGTTEVSLRCTDLSGRLDECEAMVTVVDTTPPAVKTGPSLHFWPPSQEYQKFSLSDCVISVVDPCLGEIDIEAAGRITRIESDEEELSGDDTCDDMVITDKTTALLRMEQDGALDGRVYTVHFVVTDPAGNKVASSCQVGVRHEKADASKPAVDSGCAFCVGKSCGKCPGHAKGCGP